MPFVESYLEFALSVIFMMVLSYLIVLHIIRQPFISLIVVLLKYSFFILYFSGLCYIYPVLLTDDITYFTESVEVFKKSADLSYFISEEGLGFMGSLAGGFHFGYYIYNVIAFRMFGGPSYFAPVLLNLFFSVWGGVLFYRILRMGGIERRFAKFAFIFFLLQWDIMSWSSFINLKDTLVLFLMTAGIYNIVKINIKRFSVINIIFILVILFVLQFVRFYIAYFLVVAAIIHWLILRLYRIRSSWADIILKAAIFVIMPAGFYIIFTKLFSGQLAQIGDRTNVVFGAIRFLLTPVPLNIDPDYKFITIASVCHWLTLPLSAYGFYIFAKKYFITLMPLAITAILLIIFYGSFSELQGPRHRISLLGFTILLQAIGIWELLKFIVAHIKRTPMVDK